jgi:hypothetical protein
MSEIVLGLFLVIILALTQLNNSPKNYFHAIPPMKGIITNKCCLTNFRYIDRNKILINIFSKEIHQIYNSDMNNKREFIVKRLDEMSEIMDLDDIFNKCEYLHSYIFNTYG